MTLELENGERSGYLGHCTLRVTGVDGVPMCLDRSAHVSTTARSCEDVENGGSDIANRGNHPDLAAGRPRQASGHRDGLGLVAGRDDVDFVWRLDAVGWNVRYEAAVTSRHRPRRVLLDVVSRRWAYGTSAGPLARRHPEVLAAVRASPWTLAAWLAMVGGRPDVATVLLLWSWLRLWSVLEGVPDRGLLSGRLVGRGFLGMARPLASALTRSWGPLTVVTIATRSRLRYRVVALVAAGMAMEWWERKPDLDPLTFSVMAVLDDLLYCGGVWEGCVRSRRIAPLLPRTGRPKIGQ